MAGCPEGSRSWIGAKSQRVPGVAVYGRVRESGMWRKSSVGLLMDLEGDQMQVVGLRLYRGGWLSDRWMGGGRGPPGPL